MRPSLRLLSVLCSLAAALLAPLPAAAQATPGPRSPGSGFVDPQGIPPRPVPRDTDPVYRGPTVDTLATAHTAVARRKGDPNMLNYVNTVLEFHRASGWLAERTRYWTDHALRPR